MKNKDINYQLKNKNKFTKFNYNHKKIEINYEKE